ncbi:MAG TPA: hypothetical protein VFU62_13285 [Hanamia sp.]|nr:hypothetical protein [Hanamia sp.]
MPAKKDEEKDEKMIFCLQLSTIVISANAQSNLINIDSLYQLLPASMHVYKSSDPVDGKPIFD